MIEALAVVVVLLAVLAAAGLGVLLRSIFRAIDKMRDEAGKVALDLTMRKNEIDDLYIKIGDLERCQQKRLTHRTAAGVEDALAVAMDALRLASEAELEIEAGRRRQEKVLDILRAVRGDEYDPETPAGKKITTETLRAQRREEL